jgi:hypothetical protein
MPGVDDLPALLAMIDEMRETGYTEQQIEEYLGALDRQAFDEATEEMRAAGIPEGRITAFWIEVGTFGDTEPADAVDADDEETG